MTVRQTFYRAEVAGAVPKTEAGYKCVKHRLAEMRRRRLLPYDWIADSTRWQRKPPSWASPAQMLEEMIGAFRRDLWASQDAYVELWCALPPQVLRNLVENAIESHVDPERLATLRASEAAQRQSLSDWAAGWSGLLGDTWPPSTV